MLHGQNLVGRQCSKGGQRALTRQRYPSTQPRVVCMFGQRTQWCRAVSRIWDELFPTQHTWCAFDRNSRKWDEEQGIPACNDGTWAVR